MKRLVVCVALLVPGLALAKRAPSLPVMQFEAQNGADPKTAALATDAVAESLRDLNVFKVISSDDIKKILSFQRDKALVSGKCNEEQCLAEIGGALGADYMVSGKVTKLGGAYKLDVQLFNNAKAKVDASVSQADLKSDQGLVEAAKVLARRVVAPILEKNSGQLFVNVTDQGAAGATLEIDDKIAGITVPPGTQVAPVPLGWGPHHVRVKKEGFLTFEKDVQIDEGQSTTLVVTLIPSPDFIEAYQSKNGKLRVGAYLTGALAIAAGGFALWQNNDNVHLYKAYDAQRQYQDGSAAPNLYHYASQQDACDALVRMTGESSCPSAVNKAYSKGNSQLTLIEISAGVGVAAAATAVTLYLLSDDPHRYDGFIQAAPPPAETKPSTAWLQAPRFGLSPVAGGVYGSMSVQF